MTDKTIFLQGRRLKFDHISYVHYGDITRDEDMVSDGYLAGKNPIVYITLYGGEIDAIILNGVEAVDFLRRYDDIAEEFNNA